MSRKYPRTALYSRKSALGVGLMLPSTLLAVLKLKLYIGNMRKLGNAAEAIQVQLDYQEVEAGRVVTIGEDSELRY